MVHQSILDIIGMSSAEWMTITPNLQLNYEIFPLPTIHWTIIQKYNFLENLIIQDEVHLRKKTKNNLVSLLTEV